MKRSQIATKDRYGYISEWFNESNFVFWGPNRAGYVDNRMDAGLYTLEELADCAGVTGDWIIEPTGYDK